METVEGESVRNFARLTLATGLLLVLTQGSCVQIANIPDDTLAKDLNIGAQKAVEYGLKLLLKKVPAEAQAILDNAKLANEVLKTNIIPIFSGASTGDVLRSAVDTALAQLWAKATPQIRDAIQLTLTLLSANIPLPANPADKLDERTRKALSGFFSGLSAGIDAVVSKPPTMGPITAKAAVGFVWSDSK
jgi:hypothetical protein